MMQYERTFVLICAICVGLCHLVRVVLGVDVKVVNLCVTQSEDSCNERMIDRVLTLLF